MGFPVLTTSFHIYHSGWTEYGTSDDGLALESACQIIYTDRRSWCSTLLFLLRVLGALPQRCWGFKRGDYRRFRRAREGNIILSYSQPPLVLDTTGTIRGWLRQVLQANADRCCCSIRCPYQIL